MTGAADGVGELTRRFQRPPQRGLRVTARIRLDERVDRRREARISDRCLLAARAPAPRTPTTQCRLGGLTRQLGQTRANRGTRDARRVCQRAQPAPTQLGRLYRQQQPPLAFIQMRAKHRETTGRWLRIDHHTIVDPDHRLEWLLLRGP